MSQVSGSGSGPERPAGRGDGEERPPSTRGPRGEVPGRWRFGLRVAGAAGAGLLLLYLVGLLLLRSLLDPAAVAAWLEPRAEAAMGREVEIGEARLLLFPRPGAELAGIEVSNPPGFGGPPLARVEGLRFRLAFFPLFRRQLRVDEIVVSGPRLELRIDEQGRSNYGDLAREAGASGTEGERGGEGDGPDEGHGEGAPLELAVRDLRVTDGRFAYASVPDSTELVLEKLGVRASLEGRTAGSAEGDGDGGGVWSATARMDAAETHLRHPVLGSESHPFRRLRLEATARTGGAFQWIEVEGGTLALEEAELGLAGRIDNVKDPVRRVDLSISAEGLDVGRLLPFLPPEAAEGIPGRPEGRLAVDMTLRGAVGPDAKPELRGTVTVAEGGLVGPEGVPVAEGVMGVVALVEEGAELRGFRGRALGGPFGLDATLGLEAPFPLRASLDARVDLRRFRGLVTLADGVDGEGTVEGSLEVRAPLHRLHEGEAVGTVGVEGLRLAHPRLGTPVEVGGARLLLEGRRARWEGVEVDLGPDRLISSGTLAEFPGLFGPEGERSAALAARVSASHLDLDRAVPPRGDTTLTYGTLAFARLGARRLQGRSPEEVARAEGFARPAELPVLGEVALSFDTLRSAPYTLTPARARLEFGPELMRVTEIDAGLFGGRIGGELGLGLGPEPLQPFDLRLSVSGAGAQEFLAAATPMGRRVTGTVDLELDLGGALDTLLLPDPAGVAGTGRLTVRNGRLVETPITELLARSLVRPALASPGFRSWLAPFSLDGPVLRFEEARLALDDGELFYGGSVGLDGSLDLGLRLAFSAGDLDRGGLRGALEGTGFGDALAALGAGDERLFRIGLRLRGSLEEPRLVPDASLAAGDLRSSLEAQARDTAEARLDALRDTAAERLDAERGRLEERAREEADAARRELEERGRGLLRGLFRRPGAREAPPSDTGSARPDTTLPDTTPPDTTRSDRSRLWEIRDGQPPGSGGSGRGRGKRLLHRGRNGAYDGDVWVLPLDRVDRVSPAPETPP